MIKNISYEKIKKIIEEIDRISEKYEIDDESFKQDLLILLLENSLGNKEKKYKEKKNESFEEIDFADFVKKAKESAMKFNSNKEDDSCCCCNYEDLDIENIADKDDFTSAIHLQLDLTDILKKVLTPTEKYFIELYFGLNQKRDFSIEEIAENFNVHPINVYGVLNTAIEKLRKSPFTSFLKFYM